MALYDLGAQARGTVTVMYTSSGCVHLVYNPLYEIVHMDINQSVCSTHYMLLNALHAITYITCITCHYIKFHVVTHIRCNCMHYKHYIILHFVT